MSAVLVAKLTALATDPGSTEEEARTAAHKACCLIREKKLYVTDVPPGHVPKPPPPPPPPPKPPPPPPRSPPPPPPRSRWQESEPKAKSKFTADRGKKIISRFDGWCKWCGMRYKTGDEVWWYGPGLGVDHLTCLPKRAANRSAFVDDYDDYDDDDDEYDDDD